METLFSVKAYLIAYHFIVKIYQNIAVYSDKPDTFYDLEDNISRGIQIMEIGYKLETCISNLLVLSLILPNRVCIHNMTPV